MATTKEILGALRTIQKVCEEHRATTDYCENCPCYNEEYERCSVTQMEPDNWKLNDGNGVWRALL